MEAQILANNLPSCFLGNPSDNVPVLTDLNNPPDGWSKYQDQTDSTTYVYVSSYVSGTGNGGKFVAILNDPKSPSFSVNDVVFKEQDPEGNVSIVDVFPEPSEFKIVRDLEALCISSSDNSLGMIAIAGIIGYFIFMARKW